MVWSDPPTVLANGLWRCGGHWRGLERVAQGKSCFVSSFFSRAKEQIRWLRDNKWVDRQTRAIVIDFTSVNTNTELYAATHLKMELLPTGVIACVLVSCTFPSPPLLLGL